MAQAFDPAATPKPCVGSRSSICAPNLTPSKPTAKPIDSSRQACASGPTPGPTAPPKNAPPNCPSGSPLQLPSPSWQLLTQSLRSPDSPYGSTARVSVLIKRVLG